ncbi:hypothetical protein HDU96_004077 [Phlyctochytrium bullatum]|nr:hypothetical protein HDU96_004077 [Phlyctochytrium bullatum]
MFRGDVDLDAALDFPPLEDFDGSNPLHIAIRKHNISIVCRLLEHGASIESRDALGRTPLAIAISHRDDDVATLLVSRGAMFSDAYLHTACEFNLPTTVKALLNTGRANVNALNDYLQSPLHLAAATGCIDTLRMLIDHGASANIKNDVGDTPLHVFVRAVTDPARGIKVLLSAGASLDVVGSKGRNVFHLLCMYANDSDEITRLFRPGACDYNLKDTAGDTPLMLLAMADADKPRIGVALVAAGANVMARDKETHRTPLHWAAIYRHVELMAILLKAGADPLAMDYSGGQPLEEAIDLWKAFIKKAMNGDAGIAKVLKAMLARLSHAKHPAAFHWAQLESKSLPKILLMTGVLNVFKSIPRTPEFFTALRCYSDIHEAILQGNEQVLKLFLQLEPDVNKCEHFGDFNGVTLLAWAIRCGVLQSIRVLLEHGADVERAGPDGYTALLTAVSAKKMEVLDLIMQKKPNMAARESSEKRYTAIHLACLTGIAEIVERLKAAGGDLEAVDGEGNTPLHLAVESAPEMVEVLLNFGSSPNAVGRNGRTPMHLAAQKLDKESFSQIVERLKVAGGDMEAVDGDGNTPLHLAVKNAPEMVEILLNFGSNPNAVGRYGLTPLHLAAQKFNKLLYSNVWRVLLEKGALPSAVAADGRTLLHILCQVEDDNAGIAALIYSGFLSEFVNRVDSFGRTPLHYVASCRVDKPFTGEALVSSGADVNATDASLMLTPLYRAMLHGNVDLLRVLLQAGADPWAIFSKSAFFGAFFEKLIGLATKIARAVAEICMWPKAVLELFREATKGDGRVAFATKLLYSAAARGWLFLVNLILSCGVRPEYNTPDGPSALLSALEGGYEEVAMVLISHGADWMARNTATGATALHLASARGFVRAARLLLEAGANPNVCNLRGETPLHVTATSRPEMVTLLLDAGANPLALDGAGKRPFQALTASESGTALERMDWRHRVRRGFQAAVAAFLVLLLSFALLLVCYRGMGLALTRREGVWKSSDTLAESTNADYPGPPRLHIEVPYGERLLRLDGIFDFPESESKEYMMK